MKLRGALLSIVIFSAITASCARADILYIATSNSIEKVDANGAVSTFWTNPILTGIAGLAIDSNGNLYTAEQLGANYRIEKIDAGGNATDFAIGGGTSAGMAFDQNGNLYVAANFSIEKFDTTGTGTYFVGADYPNYLAFDSSGNLYVSSGHDGTITKVDPSADSSLFANTGFASEPQGLSFDQNGNLYVALNFGNRIEKYDDNGNGTQFSSVNNPQDITFDSAGYLFAGDFFNGLMKIDAAGNGTTYVAGQGAPYIVAEAVPEPNSLLLGLLAFAAILSSRHLCWHSVTSE